MILKTGHAPGEKFGLISFYNPLECLQSFLSSLHKNYKVLLSSARNVKRYKKLALSLIFQ